MTARPAPADAERIAAAARFTVGQPIRNVHTRQLGTVTAIAGDGYVSVEYDDGRRLGGIPAAFEPVEPSPAAATREERRRELNRRTKSQLVTLVRRTLIYSMHPPERWRKDELITHVLDGEFPPEVTS